MAGSPILISLCLFLTSALIIISSSSVEAGKEYDLGWTAPSTGRTGGCQGSIAECSVGMEEFQMDSESNRRILATTDYISYGALESNTVPCSQRGASYYNCQTGAEANPYSRGCSELARCRS